VGLHTSLARCKLMQQKEEHPRFPWSMLFVSKSLYEIQ